MNDILIAKVKERLQEKEAMNFKDAIKGAILGGFLLLVPMACGDKVDDTKVQRIEQQAQIKVNKGLDFADIRCRLVIEDDAMYWYFEGDEALDVKISMKSERESRGLGDPKFMGNATTPKMKALKDAFMEAYKSDKLNDFRKRFTPTCEKDEISRYEK